MAKKCDLFFENDLKNGRFFHRFFSMKKFKKYWKIDQKEDGRKLGLDEKAVFNDLYRFKQ